MTRVPRAAAFLLDVDRFENDPVVLAMSPLARAFYALLVIRLWKMSEPGVVPDDNRVLASLCQAGEHWPGIQEDVRSAFDAESRPGFLVQRGMVRTHAEQTRRLDEHRRLGAIGGVASARARKRKGEGFLNRRSRVAQASLERRSTDSRQGLRSGSVEEESIDRVAVPNPTPCARAGAPDGPIDSVPTSVTRTNSRPEPISTEGPCAPQETPKPIGEKVDKFIEELRARYGEFDPTELRKPRPRTSAPALGSRFERGEIARLEVQYPHLDVQGIARRVPDSCRKPIAYLVTACRNAEKANTDRRPGNYVPAGTRAVAARLRGTPDDPPEEPAADA